MQPLRQDLAELLDGWIVGKAPGVALWPAEERPGRLKRCWWKEAAEMVRVDLDAAGIPFRDDAGRVFDFHALRHQFISNLAAAGVHPKEAQTLARHSTITLTMDRYTHLGVRDSAAALDKLPRCRAAQRTSQTGRRARRDKPADKPKIRRVVTPVGPTGFEPVTKGL